MEERAVPSIQSSTLMSSSDAGMVQLEKLFANWTPEQDTLNNISLKVGNKELVAIVGHVGSGKVFHGIHPTLDAI